MIETQTSDEALAISLRAAKAMFVGGSNWNKQANHIVSRNVLERDLGRYSDFLPAYHLDEDTRDRLLAHGRQDAAETLCHVSTLMDEVHKLRKTLNGLIQSIAFSVVILVLVQLWKTGAFARWWH
jgi:hypothetical protein